jgi:uncharacterized protein (DUF697 family)
VPKLGDISGVWSTIREINVSDIREAAEAPLTLALIGERDARTRVAQLLLSTSGQRATGPVPETLRQFDLPIGRERQSTLSQAALVLICVDGQRALPPDFDSTIDKVSLLMAPTLVVCLGAQQLPDTAQGDAPEIGLTPVIFLTEQPGAVSAGTLATEIVELLPQEQRVAAARRLPGLREATARALISDTSFSNASYALTSAIPEMIPVLNLPLNAADLLVLTKNQVLMVYRLGLAYGASSDFQTQMREILPVIGGGFMWRQLARQLVGIVPGFGLVPKVAVAYAGTYAAGQAAMLWYSRGEVLSKGALGRLYRQALTLGRQRAQELLSRRNRLEDASKKQEKTDDAEEVTPSKWDLRRFLPGRSSPPAPPAPPQK